MLEHAYDLLKPGESAVVLLTNGFQFTVGPNGSGTSGNWKVRANLSVDRVIVYCRDAGRIPRRADVYLADFVGAVPSREQGRSVVLFQNAILAGTTNRNWIDFADAGTNPVRYLTKK